LQSIFRLVRSTQRLSGEVLGRGVSPLRKLDLPREPGCKAVLRARKEMTNA
jgi:hypothetical protein